MKFKCKRPVLYFCRHCSLAVTSRQTRGLCWTCRMRPHIRDQYPPLGFYGQAGARQNVTRRNASQQPARPTSTLPGTKERMAVYAARYAAGESLWHPDDSPVLDNYERGKQ
jgi:hypothetical protein